MERQTITRSMLRQLPLPQLLSSQVVLLCQRIFNKFISDAVLHMLRYSLQALN